MSSDQDKMKFFAAGSFLDALVVDWNNYSFKYASFEEDREGTLKRIKKVLTNYWTYHKHGKLPVKVSFSTV